jgi:lipopolysaccharide/colanic/teichoic acid biosynthesis glycosyltransferase
MVKRVTDVIISLVALLILSPFFIIIAILVFSGSKGPVFYRQTRVGYQGRDFRIFKFRTMFTGSDKGSLITIGGRDPRITPLGYFLRKYKLDELPQLLNVISADMSLVGPRPEVRKYVDMYGPEQLKVLQVKPGITDYASIKYSNENEILGRASDPEYIYVHEIMPAKLALNLQYINDKNLWVDFKIILQTIFKIVI